MKIIITLFALVFSICCGGVLFYSTQIKAIEEVSLSQLTPQKTDKLKYHIENINNNQKTLTINGWITNTDKNFVPSITKITAILKGNNEAFSIPTEIHERKDLVAKLNIHSLKKNLGFSASVMKGFLAQGNYEFYLLLEYNDKDFLVNTHEQISL